MTNKTNGGEGASGYIWTDMTNHVSHRLRGRKSKPEHIEKIRNKLKGRKRPAHVVEKVRMSLHKSRIPSRIFTQMKKVLLGKPFVNLNYLETITGVPARSLYKVPDQPPVVSRKAIEASAALRRGKPAWNTGKQCPQFAKENNPSADLNVYSFVHTSGDMFIGTRYELCDKYSLSIGAIGKLFYKKANKRAFGWSLVKESHDATS